MPNSNNDNHGLVSTLTRDLGAGMVVFLVALPLCLGIALASKPKEMAEPHLMVGPPLIAGLVAGIIGGIVVGLLSGSHTSVTGPAAGLTTVVAGLIYQFGYDAFLFAVIIGGLLQVALGIARAGFISAFFPSSVIKGLLAAIGTIFILKQIPHVFGHDTDPEGDMAYQQGDQDNTFTALISTLYDLHPGAAIIGVASLVILVLWDRFKFLKESKVPSPLVVVAFGVAMDFLFGYLGKPLDIETSHLVNVPVAKSLDEFMGFFPRPDFTQWSNQKIYWAGATIAIVASLETLLNIEAVDKLDPKQRETPSSRELIAQGVGNVVVGLLGGIPVTSVVVRGSVNINVGAQTKMSAIIHGILLMVSVMFLPTIINKIPLSCLGAILLMTGIKLASPALFKQMWAGGVYQFIPFVVTLVAIVLTDLLWGIAIGLAISISFILYSNLRRPVKRVVEKHLGGEVLHIELANQVSFLNRAALEKILRGVPRGGHVLLDASQTHYIDPDVLDLIRDFREKIAPAHGVQVSLRGFRQKYQLDDEIQFVDYSTRDLQEQLTSDQILQILKEGNERFRTGHRLSRDYGRQMDSTAKGQHPLAVVLSCIDSRTPAEIIFDLGLGDIFSVRVAGNVSSPKIIGSIEYGCAVAGAKLVLVMGHTRCGAVTAAVDFACTKADAAKVTGCSHLPPIIKDIQQSIDERTCELVDKMPADQKSTYVDDVARRNVLYTTRKILEESPVLRELVQQGRIQVVGAIYDIVSGRIDYLAQETAVMSQNSVVGYRISE